MEKLKNILNLCGTHLAMILCGAVLVLFPDSAVTLVTKAVAWLLIILGVYNAVKLLSGCRTGKGWFYTISGLLLGGIILANPLLLSNFLGRFFGMLLMIQGLGDLVRSHQKSAQFLNVLTLLVGLVLVLIPRTLINTALALVGLVLIVIGAVNCLGKLGFSRRLKENSDPNIIDADE